MRKKTSVSACIPKYNQKEKKKGKWLSDLPNGKLIYGKAGTTGKEEAWEGEEQKVVLKEIIYWFILQLLFITLTVLP